MWIKNLIYLKNKTTAVAFRLDHLNNIYTIESQTEEGGMVPKFQLVFQQKAPSHEAHRLKGPILMLDLSMDHDPSQVKAPGNLSISFNRF